MIQLLQHLHNFIIRDHMHELNLMRHVPQHIAHLAVTLYEPEFSIFQPMLFCESLDEQAGGLEVVARETREEVVRYLQVEAAVHEGEVFGADYVCCGAQLTVGEGFGWAEVGC